MSENGLMDSVNDVVKAAFELYAADGKKLNDGDSFTVKFNNSAHYLGKRQDVERRI